MDRASSVRVTAGTRRKSPGLELVPVGEKPIEPYAEIVGDDVVEEIVERAARLKGARVLHINATAFGGGVAELLYTLVPLSRSVGLDAEWRLIRGSDDFFHVTKSAHNGLQGMEVVWTEHMEEIYLSKLEENAREWGGEYDFVVCHDPQTAGLLRLIEEVTGKRPSGQWIWRCHIDLTRPYQPVMDFFRPYITPFDAHVYTLDEFVPEGIDNKVAIITPCIDPLGSKNLWISRLTIRSILEGYRIDPDRPIVCQISRFDPWKDPIGVIDAYRIAKSSHPDLQLILAGSMASDDPEGWHYFNAAEEHRAGEADIFLLTNMQGVGNTQVNAFQRAADVVIQKSLREGFGLTVSEALWKETPVIGGNVGGIKLQVIDGRTGFLVESPQECGEKLAYLLSRPDEIERMGKEGKEHVRKNFLSTNYLLNYLKLFNELTGV
ncbi:MAG: glycosyl transferase family 1 [Acidimicrobiia bacterium]